MKNKSLVLMLQFLLVICGCSPTPDITGLWRADFWDDAYIKIDSNMRLYVYKDFESVQMNQHYTHGGIRFHTANDKDCLRVGSYKLGESAPITEFSAAIEFVDSEHFILKNDPECVYEPFHSLVSVTDLEKVNLRKVE